MIKEILKQRKINSLKDKLRPLFMKMWQIEDDYDNLGFKYKYDVSSYEDMIRGGFFVCYYQQ